MTASRVLCNADRSILVNANREVAKGAAAQTGVLSGYCTVSDDDGMKARITGISDYMGVKPGCILINTGGQPDNATWASVRNRAIFDTLAGYLDDQGIMPIINIPIVPGSLAGKFSQCAAGDYNTEIDALGQDIKDQGVTKVAFRIGHEANLRKSFPYACDYDRDNNYVNYKAAFNKVAQRLLLKVPTAFIEWSMFHTGTYRPPGGSDVFYDAEDIYPGGTYITHIGCDWYDSPTIAQPTNYTTWKSQKQGTFQKGLKSWADFARLKGKRFTVSEWGSRPSKWYDHDKDGNLITNNSGGGGDNPDFIKHWKTATLDPDFADIWDWHSYFRIDAADSEQDDATAHSLFYFNGQILVANLVIKTPFQGRNGAPSVTANSPAFGGSHTYIGGEQCGSRHSIATGNMTPWYRYLFGTGPLPT